MASVHRVEQLEPPLGPNVVLVRKLSFDRQGIVGCSIGHRSSSMQPNVDLDFGLKPRESASRTTNVECRNQHAKKAHIK